MEYGKSAHFRGDRMLKLLKIILSAFVLLIWAQGSTSCALAKDRVYGGRVIDFETKEPIEGAVVVAYWDERMAAPAGGVTRLKEVKEILTDKNGAWRLAGPEEERGDSYYSFATETYYIQHPRFIVFKPGYCPWPGGFSIDACRGKIKPGGAGKVAEGENVELFKLIEKEVRFFSIPAPDYSTDPNKRIEFLKKQVQFLKFINEEKRNLGLSENQMYKEIEHEK